MNTKSFSRAILGRLSPYHDLAQRLSQFLATEPKNSASYKRVAELLALAAERKLQAERG